MGSSRVTVEDLTLRRDAVPAGGTDGGEHPSSRRRWVRSAAAVGLRGLMGFGAVLLVAISVLNVLGFRSLVVMSGSMAPSIRTGDLVIDRRVTPLEVRAGDIVTFRDPHNAKLLITHRVRSARVQGDQVAMVTKGDANNSVERFLIRPNGTMGRVVLRIPKIGYVVFWARSRFGVFAVLIIPTLLLGAYLLMRIWRPSNPEATRGHGS